MGRHYGHRSFISGSGLSAVIIQNQILECGYTFLLVSEANHIQLRPDLSNIAEVIKKLSKSGQESNLLFLSLFKILSFLDKITY